MHNDDHDYGNLRCYMTGRVLRQATRADWLDAQRYGDKRDGTHRTSEFGDLTIYCDGPDEDPVEADAEERETIERERAEEYSCSLRHD